MSSSFRALYVRQAPYPWDIRVEKICSALREHGWEVEIVARRGVDQPPVTESEGIMIHRVGPRWPRLASLPFPGNPAWPRLILERINHTRPDIVIARDIPVAMFVQRAVRRTGIPWVIDMAEHYPAAMRSWKKYRRNPALRLIVGPLRVPDRIERQAVLGADGIMTVCEEQKTRLCNIYGVSPSKVVTVLNTPTRSRFECIPSAACPSKTLKFAYHGFVGMDRDLLTVLRGFDLAASRNASITLHIAGGGESLEDLRVEAAKLRSRDRISISGRFLPADQNRLYADTDFGIVACAVNEFTEHTVPNKFFDYAGCGRPFIFTATAPTLSLMKALGCGFPYRGGDPGDVARAMLQIAASDYAMLADNGRRAVRDIFNWETDAARMSSFLRGILEAR